MNWLTRYTVLDNSLQAWLTAIGIIVLILVVLAVATRVAARRLGTFARQGTALDRVLESMAFMLRGTRWWLMFFVAQHFGLQVLDLPQRAYTLAGKAAAVALLLQIGVWGSRQVKFWIADYRDRAAQETNLGATTSLGAINFIGMTVLWALVLLTVLQSMGVNITALVAGLGVGGIAVALAVQNILGDLFASLSIVIDRPFEVGDFVVVDDLAGTVEQVGLKTTRVRALSGEQLVFANSDLLGARVHNYKRMQTRRIVFEFGVLYSTPHDKLSSIPATVREILEGIDNANYDRSHFKAFGASSYDFETVYIMQTPDFNAYMDVQQTINLELVRRFAEQGISFAFPTRTIDFSNPLTIRPLQGADAKADAGDGSTQAGLIG
ncbi:mechanosensitive ion channel family protein [Pseudoxanthomonas spadix]|uniref:mechanosensitive ion channel family protein n=1 Tax=Pseudoxanthomonas spadix TaxID=415229 RepID=UPI001B32B085|nr:mechanosensitive ion channel family protein [Pseudoxanthomonas spadix]MBP3973177.1 mechanosensitive ion channel family protein [Pseudoxanthomonas spadix]